MNQVKKIILTLGAVLLTASALAKSEISIRFLANDNLVNAARTEADIEATAQDWIADLNEFYENSGVMIEAKYVNITFKPFPFNDKADLEIEMADAASGDLTSSFAFYKEKNDFTGADFLIILTDDTLQSTDSDGTVTGLCGFAADVHEELAGILNKFESWAFVDAENPGCAAETFAHELGHLMGIAHGEAVADEKGDIHRRSLEDYGKGWGFFDGDTDGDGTYDGGDSDPGEFGTLMVGNHINGGADTVVLFSNPLLSDPGCGFTTICGDAENGDAVRAINEYADVFANHEDPDLSFLTFADNNLDVCVEQSNPHAPFSIERVLLDVVECANFSISNLGGIEQLIGAQSINLSNNLISDITPLLSDDFKLLHFVDLHGNDTIQCSQLNDLDERIETLIRPDNCNDIATIILTTVIVPLIIS